MPGAGQSLLPGMQFVSLIAAVRGPVSSKPRVLPPARGLTSQGKDTVPPTLSWLFGAVGEMAETLNLGSSFGSTWSERLRLPRAGFNPHFLSDVSPETPGPVLPVLSQPPGLPVAESRGGKNPAFPPGWFDFPTSSLLRLSCATRAGREPVSLLPSALTEPRAPWPGLAPCCPCYPWRVRSPQELRAWRVGAGGKRSCKAMKLQFFRGS